MNVKLSYMKKIAARNQYKSTLYGKKEPKKSI